MPSSVRKQIPVLLPHTSQSLSTVPSTLIGFVNAPIIECGRRIVYYVAKRYLMSAVASSQANSGQAVVSYTGLTLQSYAPSGRVPKAGDLVNFDGHEGQYTILSVASNQFTLTANLTANVLATERMYIGSMADRSPDFIANAIVGFESTNENTVTAAISDDANPGDPYFQVLKSAIQPLQVNSYLTFSNHSQRYRVAQIDATTSEIKYHIYTDPTIQVELDNLTETFTIDTACNDSGFGCFDRLTPTRRGLFFLVHKRELKVYGILGTNIFQAGYGGDTLLRAALLDNRINKAHSIEVQINAGNIIAYQNGQALTFSDSGGSIGTTISLASITKPSDTGFYNDDPVESNGFWLARASAIIENHELQGRKSYIDELKYYEI